MLTLGKEKKKSMLCPLGKNFPCGIQDVNSYASTNVCFAILSPYQVPNLARQILGT